VKIIKLPNPDGGITELDYDSLAADERAEVDPLLAEYEALCEGNPLWSFQPFGRKGTQEGAQVAFLAAGRIKIKMGTAGNQAGKTEIGVVDDIIQCVDRDVVPPWLRQFKFWEPPFLLRVVTSDLNNSLFGVMIPKWQRLVPRDQLKGGSWDAAFSKTRRVLHFRNGSSVQFLSSDQDRTVHQGATLDRVHFDEEPPPPTGYDIYKESRFRVLAREGQLMFTMTPLLGISWSYDEIWERRNDPNSGILGFQWSLLDNPWISTDAIQTEIAACRSEREYKARIDGDFVSFRGRVLEQFEDRHILEPLKPKLVRKFDVIVGIDPGLSKGGVVWCAFDKENRLVVFDELYVSNTPLVSPDPKVDTIVKAIRMKNKQWGIKPLYYVIDPAARIRDMVSAHESVMTALVREGFAVIAGENDRQAGILEMWGRLEADPPALMVTKNCTNWLRERDRWLVHMDEEGAEARPRGGKGATFTTIGPDHLMDPTRYVAMARAWGTFSLRRAPAPDSYRRNHAPRMSSFGNFRREEIEVS
jgi:phage terminase large subunit-like protein